MVSRISLSTLRGKKRGQVFILASLLLVVYAISIMAILSEMSVLASKDDDEGEINQLIDDLFREIDIHNTIVMARVTQGSITLTDASTEISTFFVDYENYLQNKGMGSAITILNTGLSPDLRSSDSIVNETLIINYISVTVQIVISSSISTENLEVTTTVFTGYQAEYDGVFWHISRINNANEILEPIEGAEFFLNSIQTPVSNYFNGYYEISFDNSTAIHLPNGVRFYN